MYTIPTNFCQNFLILTVLGELRQNVVAKRDILVALSRAWHQFDVQQAAIVRILQLSSKFKVYLIKLCFAYKVLNSAAFPAPVAKYIHHFQKPQNIC